MPVYMEGNYGVTIINHQATSEYRAICLWKMVTGQADICNKLMQVDSLFKIHDTMIDIGEELKKID